jgi:hypothetical protein
LVAGIPAAAFSEVVARAAVGFALGAVFEVGVLLKVNLRFPGEDQRSEG